MAEFVQSEMKVIKPDGAILVTPKSLEILWNELGDIPVDDDGIIMKRLKLWNKWRKRCINPWYYKLFVLFGIIKSPTFEMYCGMMEEN